MSNEDPEPLMSVLAPWRDDEEALEEQALESRRELQATLFTSVFEESHARNTQALADTQHRLTELRRQVKDIYAEIKVLVEEEALLRRMVAVGKKHRA